MSEAVTIDQLAESVAPTAWILWGRARGGLLPKPLGAYVSLEVARRAEQAAREHIHAPLWEDFWVTPWPLRDEPTVNFRMEMAP